MRRLFIPNARIFVLCALLCWLGAPAVQAQQPTKTALEITAPPEEALDGGPLYQLRSGDKLSIKFPYHQELSEPTALVRPDGFISLPLVNDVKAGGLTVTELKASVEKAYSEILLNPVVTINLLEFVPPRIFVNGQVAKPGSYDLRAGQTLLQAIALAGGFTREANRKLVLHAQPDGEGRLRVTPVNVLELLTQSGAAREIKVQNGDYIFVPDSKIAKIARVMDAFRSLVPGIGLAVGY